MFQPTEIVSLETEIAPQSRKSQNRLHNAWNRPPGGDFAHVEDHWVKCTGRHVCWYQQHAVVLKNPYARTGAKDLLNLNTTYYKTLEVIFLILSFCMYFSKWLFCRAYSNVNMCNYCTYVGFSLHINNFCFFLNVWKPVLDNKL